MRTTTPVGRLTLSWVNKDKALVPNVDLGGYTWVERDDPRLTEVRLLKELDRSSKSLIE
jgi:adenine-specific DNA-methyltransferase